MARFGFCGGTYTLQSENIDAEEAINLYCEQPESPGAKTSIALLHTPGLAIAYTLGHEEAHQKLTPEPSVPALFEVNGRAFAAATQFYELLAAPAINVPHLNWIARGLLNGPPLSPTQIICNQTHLLILSNGALFIFVLTPFTDANNVLHPANSFLAVDMSQFNGPVLQIGFLDGYFIAVIQNSNTFQVSALEDGTSWSGLFISTISYFPDNITSMVCDHREIWFYSGKRTVVYYNAGAGYPPFIPIQGAYIESGSGATFATVQANNTVAWIEADERGGGRALLAAGYVGQRISTYAVEFAWQGYGDISNAVGYTYQDQGHIFWVIRFPSANVTWVYDFASSLWHKRLFFQNGQYTAHRSTSHCYVFGKHLVGDWASGNIYEMSIDLLDDFGNPIRWLRRSPTISKENAWIYFSRIEFDLEVGLGPQPPLLDGDGQPRAPQVMLRWSNDAAKTWSNEYILNCGQAGDYDARVYKTQLGRGRKRVWELSGTDPVPIRIADAYLEATCEGEPIYKGSERISEQMRKVT